MADFITVKEDVKKKGFGTSLYDHVNGEPVYLSPVTGRTQRIYEG